MRGPDGYAPAAITGFLVAAGADRTATREIGNARAVDRPRLTLRADMYRAIGP